LRGFQKRIGAAVAGALDEVRAARHGVAQQRLHRERERLFDEAVNHQPVRGGVDLGNAVVMALEVEAARCNRAFKRM
jgi:hypothetical protein